MTKILSCAAVAGLLVASSSSVFAGGGASHFSPAYASDHPSSSTLTPVPGRSGPSAYAPGQQMQAGTLPKGVTAAGNGASVWAPGFLK
jgi:hypothetical protein